MFKVDIPNKQLVKLHPATFAELNLRERFDIQEWIEKTPAILGEELLVIGKEFILSSGKRLDLLCIDKSAKLVIVELKRDDSGQSVEWQAIKYASYCSNLLDEEVFRQCASYMGCDEVEARQKIEEFIEEDIEALNESQRIILVSKEFNSEVISAVIWLREFGVDIQCTRLAPFLDGKELFIKPETLIPVPEARDYIERKEEKQRINATARPDWKGEWFVNVGEGDTRSWQDNIDYNYLGAGGKPRYSRPLYRLKPGDRVYAYLKGQGYVGYGEVVQTAMPIREFTVGGKPLLEMKLRVPNAARDVDNDDLCEHAVGIKWLKTVPSSEAKTFTGVFANQNVVCKLRHEDTLKFVQSHFAA